MTQPRQSSTFTVDGTSYDLQNVSSVSLIRPVLSRGIGWGVAVLGAIILVLGYVVWGVFLTPMLAGSVMLIAGLVIAFTVRESYTVRLNHEGGEPTLIQFTNPAAAQEAVTQIGAAVAQRRTTSQPPLEREVGR